MFFDKKMQRRIGIVIAIVVSIAMLVTLIPGGFDFPDRDEESNPYTYENLQAVAKALEQQVAQAPDDVELRLDLANAYYDLGVVAQQSAPEAVAGHFQNALEHYQEVLKTKADDAKILVDAATAAYYAGDNSLAEEYFQKALSINPDYLNGLVNYGLFLVYAKNDVDQAIALWQQAVDRNPDGTNADFLKELIAQMKERKQKEAEKDNNTEGAQPSENNGDK